MPCPSLAWDQSIYSELDEAIAVSTLNRGKEFAYRPEAWQNMFATVALVAATLIGLLFVGLSINLRTIVDSPAHLARAREAMTALVVLLILSLLALIPDQERSTDCGRALRDQPSPFASPNLA
jgi:hypothetical protein